MAKDLEFESDRYEKRQSIKRWLIPAAALLGVIAVAVVVALLLRANKGETFTGGEDTPYPYRWTENKNGTVSLEIDRAAAPDAQWTAPEDALDLTVETSQGDDRTVFTLTPGEQGRSVITFVLRDETGDRLYERSVLTNAAYEGKTLVLRLESVSSRQLIGTIRGGEDTPFPYLLRTDEDGDLMLIVTEPPAVVPEEEEVPEDVPLPKKTEPREDALLPEEEEVPEAELLPEGENADEPVPWQCESGDEAVAAVLGVISSGEINTAYLRPGAAQGTTWVRMYNEGLGAALTLEVSSDGSGSLLVLSHSMSAGEAVG